MTVGLLSRRGSKPVAAALAGLALLLAALLAPAGAGAQSPSLNDLEDEVMCPVCGTLLQLAEAPQAQRQRAFIDRQIAAGRDKEQIKDALVAEYGREVLAQPEGSGFSLSAYLVPAVAFLVALVGLGIGVARWRRASGGPGPRDGAGGDSSAAGPSDEDAERLKADLARYDL